MSKELLDSRISIAPELDNRSLQGLTETKQLTIAHDLAVEIELKRFLNLLMVQIEPPALLSLIFQKCSRSDVLESHIEVLALLNGAPKSWVMELNYYLLDFCYEWPSWKMLSGNQSLLFSIELIERYGEQWNWSRLSVNESLPWSLELIEHFVKQWDWQSLSSNRFLPWSLELIEHFEKQWDWYSLSSNRFLPWSLELVERYREQWDWCCLSGNESLAWSLGW